MTGFVQKGGRGLKGKRGGQAGGVAEAVESGSGIHPIVSTKGHPPMRPGYGQTAADAVARPKVDLSHQRLRQLPVRDVMLFFIIDGIARLSRQMPGWTDRNLQP